MANRLSQAKQKVKHKLHFSQHTFVEVSCPRQNFSSLRAERVLAKA